MIRLRCGESIPNEDPIMRCTTQAKMHKKGYIMTYEYKWIKKEVAERLGMEIMSGSVDWCHVHTSPECQKVKRYYDN